MATASLGIVKSRAVPERVWDFADLWLAAVCCNAQLAAARAEVELVAAAVEQAKQVPNPRLSFTPEWSANSKISGNPTPIALGRGEAGREIEGPMALLMVGGLCTSTLLNLLVLPALCLRFGRFDRGTELP